VLTDFVGKHWAKVRTNPRLDLHKATLRTALHLQDLLREMNFPRQVLALTYPSGQSRFALNVGQDCVAIPRPGEARRHGRRYRAEDVLWVPWTEFKILTHALAQDCMLGFPSMLAPPPQASFLLTGERIVLQSA